MTARTILRTGHVSSHQWPSDCFLQGGTSGLVIGSTGSYLTAFVEAFPRAPDTFIRGEGATVEEADDAAWAKYQRYLECAEHEFEARGYMNGAGFCSRCGMFSSGVFTPEQLGLYCAVCGVPTLWSRAGGLSYCQLHSLSAKDRSVANAAAGVTVPAIERILDRLMES